MHIYRPMPPVRNIANLVFIVANSVTDLQASPLCSDHGMLAVTLLTPTMLHHELCLFCSAMRLWATDLSLIPYFGLHG